MNAQTAAWARRYRVALRRHLRSGSTANPSSALRLGRLAVTFGLETLDVVRVHEDAVAALSSLDGPYGNVRETTERANVFFAESIIPIEKSHQAALEAGIRVSDLTRTLRQRTLAAGAADQRLKEGVRRRRLVEAALKTSESRQTRRLAEAQRLQRSLRRMMRDILSAHENERRETSRHLQDELSQALLGIQVRLLTLKTATEANARDLQKEIDETRRMVKECDLKFFGRTHKHKGNHET